MKNTIKTAIDIGSLTLFKIIANNYIFTPCQGYLFYFNGSPNLA
jgi:hypothetical protein